MALSHANFYQPTIDYFDRQHRDMVTRIYERSLIIKHCAGPDLVRGYMPIKRYRPRTPQYLEPTSSSLPKHEDYLTLSPTTNPYIRKRPSPANVAQSGKTFRTIKHIYPESPLERAKRELELEDEELRELAHREYLVYKHRMARKHDIQMPTDIKRLLRGKSPSSISTALLYDSDRNITNARKEEELFTRHAIRALCSTLENRRYDILHRPTYVPVHKYFK